MYIYLDGFKVQGLDQVQRVMDHQFDLLSPKQIRIIRDYALSMAVESERICGGAAPAWQDIAKRCEIELRRG